MINCIEVIVNNKTNENIINPMTPINGFKHPLI